VLALSGERGVASKPLRHRLRHIQKWVGAYRQKCGHPPRRHALLLQAKPYYELRGGSAAAVAAGAHSLFSRISAAAAAALGAGGSWVRAEGPAPRCFDDGRLAHPTPLCHQTVRNRHAGEAGEVGEVGAVGAVGEGGAGGEGGAVGAVGAVGAGAAPWGSPIS
jgi:hypothetical protein